MKNEKTEQALEALDAPLELLPALGGVHGVVPERVHRRPVHGHLRALDLALRHELEEAAEVRREELNYALCARADPVERKMRRRESRCLALTNLTASRTTSRTSLAVFRNPDQTSRR